MNLLFMILLFLEQKKKKCPNNKCESHKDSNLNEVVLLSDKYTQKLYYTCCICNTEWTYS